MADGAVFFVVAFGAAVVCAVLLMHFIHRRNTPGIVLFALLLGMCLFLMIATL